jgi:hypothetical protein
MNITINNFKNTYWDNYTGGLKTIVELCLYFLFLMSISSGNSILSNILLTFLPINAILGCYKAIQYRGGKEDYLLVPTKNDNYHKISSIIIGSIIIITIIACVLLGKQINYAVVLMAIITGLGALIVGIYGLPNGMIKIAHNKIKLYKYETDQKNISLIEIKADRIILTDINGRIERIENFNIDYEWGEIIRQYIFNKINNKQLMVLNAIANEPCIV